MLKQIEKQFKNYTPSPIGLDAAYGILIPTITLNGDLHLVFEVRAHTLKTQPGEICFPGGRCEDSETPIQACVRETSEELGIPMDAISVFGPMDYLLSPFRAILYPFVGHLDLKDLKTLRPSPEEVDEIFAVSIQQLLMVEPEVHYLTTEIKVESAFPYHKIQKGRSYPWRTSPHKVIFYECVDTNGRHRIIWGLTATLLQVFLKTLQKIN